MSSTNFTCNWHCFLSGDFNAGNWNCLRTDYKQGMGREWGGRSKVFYDIRRRGRILLLEVGGRRGVGWETIVYRPSTENNHCQALPPRPGWSRPFRHSFRQSWVGAIIRGGNLKLWKRGGEGGVWSRGHCLVQGG